MENRIEVITSVWTIDGNRIKYVVGEERVKSIESSIVGIRVYLTDNTFDGYTWNQIKAYYGKVSNNV